LPLRENLVHAEKHSAKYAGRFAEKRFANFLRRDLGRAAPLPLAAFNVALPGLDILPSRFHAFSSYLRNRGSALRSLLQTLPEHSRHKMLSQGVFLLAAALVAYEAATYIVSDDVAGLAYIALAFGAGVFVVKVVKNWRDGVYLLFAWLLLEDLIRKYLGNNMVIYFAKDFLLAVVYLSFLAAWRRKDTQTFRPPFFLALISLVWFGFMQIFNPASTSIFFGLMGLKLYFYYVPLIAVGYALIDSEAALRRFFYASLGVMSIIAALGIAQSILGPRFLNPAHMADDIRLLSETYRVAPISGVSVYRPTSVFVSTGRFANMLIVNWFMVFGFSGYLLLRRRRGRAFCFLALAVTAAGCLMCGSRGVFMWTLGSAVVGAVAFVWGAPWRQGEALRMIRALQRALLGVGLAVIVLFFAYPDAFLNRLAVYSETLDPRSPQSELVSRAHTYPLRNFLAAFDYERWPYGYGIGTASLGGQYVARFFHVRPPESPVESGYGSLVLEMGIVGLCLWIIMSIAVVLAGWKVVKKLKGSPFFPLSVMLCLYSFILLIPMTFAGIQPYQDFIMNAYLWLLLGVLFRLPKLALDAQFAATDAAKPGSRWIR
jgi:hypothetical protein